MGEPKMPRKETLPRIQGKLKISTSLEKNGVYERGRDVKIFNQARWRDGEGGKLVTSIAVLLA